MNFITPELITIGGMVGSAGVAYGVVKATNSFMHSRIRDLKRELDVHVKYTAVSQLEVVQRLARIETKLDNLIEKDHERSSN